MYSCYHLVKVKVMYHTAKYGDPYLEFVLCIYPSKVHTHSSEHTHTVNTHLQQWAAIYAAAPGEQLGVRCLAQGHLSCGRVYSVLLPAFLTTMAVC